MIPVETIEIPPQSFLAPLAKLEAAYSDCFTATVSGRVDLEQYVRTFFSSRLFRMERFILRLLGRGTDDATVTALATGNTSRMAVWQVKDRSSDEILLSVDGGYIYTWLNVETGNHNSTRLYFGSVVLPVTSPKTGKPKQRTLMKALTGFHVLYSKLLLWSAKNDLLKPQH